MNDILLQKILDLLRDGLAHVGNFFKDLFISDPQDGQIIAYDADSGHWINKDAAEVELDLTNTFEAQAVATITDGAENLPMKSLVCEIDNVTGGTDTVVITHTGKNLFNPVNVLNAYLNSTSIIRSSTKTRLVYAKVNPNTTYTISKQAGQRFQVAYCDTVPTIDTQCFGMISNLTASSITITTNATANYLVAFVYHSDYDTVTPEEMLATVQIEAGSTATTYEPYTATTHTVTLSASVENGYIDIVSGQGKDTDNDTDITCTPITIKTQGGTENIFADTGDVSGEYYTKTAESVLELAAITEDITASITKNTTDFSDILLKASQNNKVVSIEIYSASTSAAFTGTFLSGLPKPAMNSKVLLVNTTLGEDGTILGTLKTSGELDITTSGAKTFSGLITYVAK